MYKTLIRPLKEYILAGTSVSKHENWGVILRMEGIQRRVTKLIKRVKYYR